MAMAMTEAFGASNIDEIHEINSVPEVWTDGAGDHFIIDSNFKYTHYSWQRIPGMDGIHRVAVLKIVRPVSSMQDTIKRFERAMLQHSNGKLTRRPDLLS